MRITRSFIKRIARGGVLAAGIAFLMGGCAIIGDGEDGEDDEAVAAASDSDIVVMCDQDTFQNVMVDGASVAQRIATDNHTIGACPAILCGAS